MTDSAALFQININHLLIGAEITLLRSLRYRLTDAALARIEEQQAQHEAEWGAVLGRHRSNQVQLAGLDRAGDVQWIPVLEKEAEHVAALAGLRRRLEGRERVRKRRERRERRERKREREEKNREKREEREEKEGKEEKDEKEKREENEEKEEKDDGEK
ncbi:hypothetical protein EDC01DRAFT_789446 [Geopyxis carbonaria]|nr:hypothetical protein EDC01DRAFT_789446 [Geopyxis carbonaria]